jgi:hypothetical protein
MTALKIRQTTEDGRSKVWKISKPDSMLTFGTSRKARLVSIDSKSQAYQSVFEFRNREWHYISFDTSSEPADRVLTPGTVIKLAQSTLSFDIVEKQDFVAAQLENIKSEGELRKQLVLVMRNNRVLETRLLQPGAPFDFQGQKVVLPQNEGWSRTELDGFLIKSKQILTKDNKNLAMNNAESVDKESKKAVLITLGVTAFIIFSALLGYQPKPALTPPVTEAKLSATTIVKNQFKKKKQTAVAKQTVPQTAPVADSGSSSSSKATAMLKGAIGVRISKLLGKVSATEARTANVLVTKTGASAADTNTGRALAAIGKVESSGRNWNGESTGRGSGVSTAGVGGGNSTKGLGSGLGQGKTGSGGVGLIEDESEIIGGLDREVIAQYIKTQLGQILYCYERQLSASPDLYGKIAVKFTIAGSGQVETQSINDTTLKNHSVENCILSKVAKWKFPEPRGGTKVLVTYPFLFKSTN